MLPPGFTLLASNDVCRIQAIKHESRLVYGVQFHPEAYTEEHEDGKVFWKFSSFSIGFPSVK